MPLTPYATVADLTTWSPSTTQPDHAFELLRSASLLIARALYEDLYNPATVHDDARRDATCAQALAWARADVDPSTTPGVPAAGVVKAKSLASAAITYETPSQAERDAAVADLAPDARAILEAAQLLYVPLPVWSQTPDPGRFVGELGSVGGYYSSYPFPDTGPRY